MQIEEWDEFEVLIKLRSGGEFVPRMNAIKLNGRRFHAKAIWKIENRKPYRDGEFALQIFDDSGDRLPPKDDPGWVASGDVTILRRLN